MATPSRARSPTAPDAGHASGLSPYLHFGHLSIEEVATAVLQAAGPWSPEDLRLHNRGKREGFFGDDPDVNSFLDEALTWRDVGFNWHWSRRADTQTLDRALPPWALATLRAHARDRRAYVYAREEWEAGATHDPLWNAAQRELRATGTIHNYLRMLWGKKIIEWSRTPDEAYLTLEHLNNKYALDGRDPELLHRHPLVLRPFRSALGPGTQGPGHPSLHVLGEHRPQVQARAVLRLRERPPHPRGGGSGHRAPDRIERPCPFHSRAAAPSGRSPLTPRRSELYF